MITLKLYSTLGCHLCEQAEALLQQAAERHAVEWQVVEIASDPRLIDRFGIRIPVLQPKHCNDELAWPFDDTALDQWLGDLKQAS